MSRVHIHSAYSRTFRMLRRMNYRKASCKYTVIDDDADKGASFVSYVINEETIHNLTEEYQSALEKQSRIWYNYKK